MSDKYIKSKIVSISELNDPMETLDIEVSGNNLFYANGILTHNSGQSNSDVGLEDVAESHGTSQTADLIFALIRTENLRDNGRVLVKQLKNRFGDLGKLNKFQVGLDISTMTFYEVDNTEAEREADKPVFDSTPTGNGLEVDLNLKKDEGIPF